MFLLLILVVFPRRKFLIYFFSFVHGEMYWEREENKKKLNWCLTMKMFFRWRRFSWKNKLSSSDYQYNSWSCIIIFLENYEWANFPGFHSREFFFFFFVESLCHAVFQVSRNRLQKIRNPCLTATRCTWLERSSRIGSNILHCPNYTSFNHKIFNTNLKQLLN